MIQEFRGDSILIHPSQQSEEKSGSDPKWPPVFGADYLGMWGGFSLQRQQTQWCKLFLSKCLDIDPLFIKFQKNNHYLLTHIASCSWLAICAVFANSLATDKFD